MSSKRVVHGLLIGSSAAFGLTIAILVLSMIWPIWQISISVKLWLLGGGSLVGAVGGMLTIRILQRR